MEFLAAAGGNTEWSLAYWKWLAAGIFMNIMICTRTRRWKDPEDICWFD